MYVIVLIMDIVITMAGMWQTAEYNGNSQVEIISLASGIGARRRDIQ